MDPALMIEGRHRDELIEVAKEFAAHGVGRVWPRLVVFTTLTKPQPKRKIGLCICEEDKLFVWFNTAPQRHGEGQLKCAHGDHPALTHDCCLDL
jgi:hypothetical protein